MMTGKPLPMRVMHHARHVPVSQYLVRIALVLVVLAAAGGIAMLTFRGPSDGKIELTVFWWGGKARAALTQQVLDLYSQKHPNVRFTTQWQGNSGYYDKLATMATGGKAPDLFQIDDNGLTQYASRGVTLDLKPYIGNRIRVDEFPAALRRVGSVNGRVAGVVAAENTPAMVYDVTMVQQLGLELPRVGMSWEALVDWSVQVYTRSGGKKYGTMNPSADYKALQVWLRQQGKDLYQGANLGFAQQDLTRWLQFWADAQARHATPPADVVHKANGGDVSKQLVETQQAAISFMWSNQLEELQKGTSHQLDLVTYPGNPSGQWLRASMYWAGFSGGKHRNEVADVINFLVNDIDAARVMGAERGLAPNLGIRSEVNSTLTKAMQTTVSFETGLATQFGSPPAPPPAGHSQIRSQLTAAAENVEFAKATPAKAAEQFFAQAKSILSP
jgi:multiple sugar transport system substrate-binding protein